METLKELLMPKTFNRLSYLAVIGWILCGVTLLVFTAQMENSEPSFSCSEKSENMDLVPEKCLQQYNERYNQLGFPLYAFVILNFSLILFVCVIYSYLLRKKVELLEGNLNRDAERQRPPETRKLFVAYCCQLVARFALGILFIVLQTQLFYPFGFPTNFNCNLTLTGDSLAVNASGANIQNTTTYECHNQQAKKKTFLTNAVIVVNSVFAGFVMIEIICIFYRLKIGSCFMEDSQFLEGHLRKPNCGHRELTNNNESQQRDSGQERTEGIPLSEREPAEQDSQQQRNEIPEEPQLESVLEAMKESISKNTEKPSDLKALFTTNPGEGKGIKDLSIDKIYTNLRLHPNRAEYDFSEDREEQLKVYPEPKRQDNVNAENLKPKGPEDIVDMTKNKKVFIVGRPGIGKSLFCTKFLRDWATGRVFNNDPEIHYVAFLIKFRKFNSVENLRLRELLARSEYSQSEDIPDRVWTYIRENPKKVLILLDGLDEFKNIQGIVEEAVYNKCKKTVEQKMPTAALFSKIANGKLLSGATVVTTTRPTAMSKIEQRIDFYSVFEIVGFSPEQVEEYVKNFTKNAAENLTDEGPRIMQHIKTNMNLFSLCYVPVNCFIICSCLLQIIQHYTKTGKQLTGAVLPVKFTQIYKIAMRLFFFRHNERYKDRILSRKEIESHKFPSEVEEKIFKPLGKLAFDGVNKPTKGIVFDEVKGLEDSALFHQLPDSEVAFNKHEAQFCFIHLTMQEFFAARHIVDTMNEAQLRGFFSKHIKKGKWHVVLQFVVGLLDERKRPITIFSKTLPTKTEKRGDGCIYWPNDSDKRLALTIIKCSLECESKQSQSVVNTKLEEIGFNAVDFSFCDLAPSDCTAVVHVLENVRQINIGSMCCVEIRKSLDNGNCQITQLNLNNNNIDDNGVLVLCQGINNSKLTSLFLNNNKISDMGVDKLCDVLANPDCKLTVLHLCGNDAITAKAKQGIKNANRNCRVDI